MAGLEGRAIWPSLFIFTAGALLLAASLLPDQAYRWAAIALLLAASAPWRLPMLREGLGLLVALLCGWMLLNAVFVTPAYAAESLYRPLILAGAFAATAALPREALVRLYRAGFALMAALVLLGLVQHFFGVLRLDNNPLRAAATFVTPNTFAAAINLFLLPAIVVYLSSTRSPGTYWAALWLFAGLVATQSRGGMLAMVAGLGFVALCLGRDRLKAARLPGLKLAAGGLVVWVAIVALGKIAVPLVHGGDLPVPSLNDWVGRAYWDRSEIYATTLQLILERPFAGAGANMFWALFEPRRAEIFGDKSFFFAHNDYLQFWLEFGLAGMLLLAGLGAAALLGSRRQARANPGEVTSLAVGAALASVFAQALVDFPFYVPFLLAVAGGMLGALSAFDRRERSSASPAASAGLPVVVRSALAVAGLAWLAQPMLAQMASSRSLAALGRGDVFAGLYWQSVARRLEPRDPQHYWAEATTWKMLAVEEKSRDYWAKADALLAEGARANPPLSATLVLNRARMQRMYHGEIANPATPEQILGWVEEAVARMPRSPIAQAELARALAFAGRNDEARRVGRALAARHPDSSAVRALEKELE